MARKMTEWPSKRGPITKIMPSDGCKGDTVPLAVGKWYDYHEFGWHLRNVGKNNGAAARGTATGSARAYQRFPIIASVVVGGIAIQFKGRGIMHRPHRRRAERHRAGEDCCGE